MSVPTSEHFSNSCYTALRIIDTIVDVKSWFIVVLICISLMTNNAEYLFMWVKGHWYNSSGETSIQIFHQFFSEIICVFITKL